MGKLAEGRLEQRATDSSSSWVSVRACGRILTVFAGLGSVRVCGRYPGPSVGSTARRLGSLEPGELDGAEPWAGSGDGVFGRPSRAGRLLSPLGP
eukprot:5734390-Alexandrium_andersonii.AAC.1